MWKFAQAAVQGRGHITSGVPCQDKTYIVEKQGACAIALADGAGSARYSQLGAECAVKTISNLLIDKFLYFYNQSDSDIVRHLIISGVLDDLVDLSDSIGCAIQELASTLLCVAVFRNQYLIVHLGDGVVGYYENDCLKVASTPNNGEYCNTTVFTTSPDAEKSIKLYKGTLEDDISGFVLFSDGVGSILYKHTSNQISQSLSPVFHDLCQFSVFDVQRNLQETLEEIREHTMDDCSIVVMSKTYDKKQQDTIINEDILEMETSISDTLKNKYLTTILIISTVLVVFSILFALAIHFNLLWQITKTST